jgi:hypothetical protein
MKISRYRDIDMILETKGRKKPNTLIVTIEDKTFGSALIKASITFFDVVQNISEIVGVDRFIADVSGKVVSGGMIIGLKKEDFTISSREGLRQSSSFMVNTHSSTINKKRRLEYLIDLYKINGSVEIINFIGRVDSEVEEEMVAEEEMAVDSDFVESSNFVVNPFGGESEKNSDKESSAICVIGKSGAGKSYRIEKTLDYEGHVSEVIIPSSSTTNLLVQYTQGKYVLSRLGKFILAANSDKSKCYTIVFDECHKYIDMINDELLQCISTKRNNGLRFISLDPVTDELFSELLEKNGRRIIPDNLGFIFISSKEEVIRNNSDFYNRVDIITIDKSDRDIDFAIEILKDKIESREDEGYSMEE